MSLDSPFLQSDVEDSLASLLPDARVVVYAGILKALCVAQGLIERGVAPARITVVRPIRPGAAASASSTARASAPISGNGSANTSWSLGGASIDAGVEAAVAGVGIVDAGDRLLENVCLNAEGGVSGVVFAGTSGGGGSAVGDAKEGRRRRHKASTVGGAGGGEAATATTGGEGREHSDHHEEGGQGNTLACELLLCGDAPNIDPDVFRAVNNSGLVYDGRLVVNAAFRTSDPVVLAGGTLTKYSRVHGPNAPRHEKYNAREVTQPMMAKKPRVSTC